MSAERGEETETVGTVDRLEGDTAVILLPDSRVVYLPADLLPAGAGEGARIVLRVAAVLPP